jgi:hypothetical protein
MVLTRIVPYPSKEFHRVLTMFDLIPSLQRAHGNDEIPECSPGDVYPDCEPVFSLIFGHPVVGFPVIRVILFSTRDRHSHRRYIPHVQSAVTLCSSQNSSHQMNILLSKAVHNHRGRAVVR